MAIVTPRLCFDSIWIELFKGTEGPGDSFSTLYFWRTAYVRVTKLDTCINQPNTNVMTRKINW